METSQRGLKRGLASRERTVILATDASIITETPPLRASWSKVGDPARIPLTGNRGKAVFFAALNITTGTRCVDVAPHWNGDSFRDHLAHLRGQWRGWNIILFLDRGSPHTAAASRQLAKDLNIELRWLPTACPELNPVENLWRWLKGSVLCNHQPDAFIHTIHTATEALEQLAPHDALRLSGALCKNFWLRT
jgi:hypothetical protein